MKFKKVVCILGSVLIFGGLVSQMSYQQGGIDSLKLVEDLSLELVHEGDTVSPYECSLLGLSETCGFDLEPPAQSRLTDIDRAVLSAMDGESI